MVRICKVGPNDDLEGEPWSIHVHMDRQVGLSVVVLGLGSGFFLQQEPEVGLVSDLGKIL